MNIRSSKINSEKYLNWKKKYEIQRKTEMKSNVRRIIFRLFLLFTISTLSYYWYIGELQFIGQETAFVNAKIVDAKMYHIGNGKFKQLVTYTFEINNTIHKGNFKAGSIIGKQQIGGMVKVKYSVNNPDRSLPVRFYNNR